MTHTTLIGGGIAGLTLANALQQAGLPFNLYEAAPAFKPLGAGIILPPNALFVFDQLQLLPAIKRAGYPIKGLMIADRAGREIQTSHSSMTHEGRHYSSIAIHRGDLQQILLDQLPERALHLGQRLSAVDLEHDRLQFQAGPEVPFKILIGCDGIGSLVRQTIFPDSRLRYSGQTCWRGVLPFNFRDQPPDRLAELWGNGLRFGFVPIGLGRLYWYATVVLPEGGRDRDLATIKAELLARYERFDPIVREIIHATDQIVRHDLHDLPPLKRWSSGRVALIGDAAHAMTPNLGQGAAQGVEDAWVMGTALAGHAGFKEAFSAFEQVRMKKGRWVSQTSWQIGQLANWQHPLLCRLRNQMMRFAPQAAAERSRIRLYTPSHLFR